MSIQTLQAKQVHIRANNQTLRAEQAHLRAVNRTLRAQHPHLRANSQFLQDSTHILHSINKTRHLRYFPEVPCFFSKP